MGVSYEQIHTWSRHYDTLQWTATGLLLAAAAALAFKVLVPEKEPADVKTICWLGLLLTAFSCYAVLSFRSLRKQVHAGLPENHLRLVRNRSWLPQWLVNYGIHLAGLGFWFGQLIKNYGQSGCAWQLLMTFYWFGVAAFLVGLWAIHVTRIVSSK